ncbi:MAG: SH3 domain-containing protein [Treponema sp.]|nr:SH3 domain-containing protein [Treponema sp.]
MKKEIPSPMGTFIEKQEAERKASKTATRCLTADLNVFTDQDGGSQVVASLKQGNAVQVLAYGEYADWNGITAKWAQVKTEDGKTGWLFSRYLEALKK